MLIGQPLDRTDGRLKVTGGARYAAEFSPPRAAYGVLVQSRIAKGRITTIDTAAAEAVPGVILVMTHRNAPRLDLEGAKKAHPAEKFPLLQDERILFNGQHVALVVAETLEAAINAAGLVQLRYDAEEPVVRLADVRDKAAVPKHFRDGARPPDSRRGDPESAFAAAPIKLDETYETAIEHHNPMEPHAVVAVWDGPDALTVYHSTQAIGASRSSLAALLGLAEDKVRTLCPYVGGGFGTKGTTWPHVTLTAMAAKLAGRPVKLTLSRRQMYSSNGFRSHTIQRLRLAADRDGRLAALMHDGILQTADYAEFVEPVGLASEMMYACPNVAVTHRVAAVAMGIPTFMRAPGEASGMLALESAMDELAYACKLDPLELRLRNYAERDAHEDRPWSSKSLRECYSRGAAAFGWPSRSHEPRSMREGETLIGWGMASATYPANRSPASARVRLLADGTAIVESGTQDIGTGTYTIMTQVAAETLGLPAERVRARLGDSAMPKAPVSGGSQSAASVMPAVQAAALQVRERVLALGTGPHNGPLAGLDAAELDIANGEVFHKSEPARRESFVQLLLRAREGEITGAADAKPGDEKKNFSMHSFGAHFVELSVSPLAEIRIRRYVGAFAAGRVLNAKTARSQMLGGIVYGMGMALFEETTVDRRSGRVVNANIAEYLVPVHADVPAIEVILVAEEDAHVNPLGIKGMGELPMVGAAAAIANAVYHATGIRVREMPIRPDKLIV